MKRLVLFDIDGTLLHGGPLWRECFEAALRSHFPDNPYRPVSYNGKTDPWICQEFLGLPTEAHDQECTREPIFRVIRDYLDRAESRIDHRAHEIEVLPGARELAASLAEHPDVALGLLTGNVRRGAEIKLRAVNLFAPFEGFGVFGDDHWNRYELPRIAVERAHGLWSRRFSGKEIVIIGDTVHDVKCGESIGVRSIAVGTGHGVDRRELLAAGPDYFFSDLSDIESVIQAILED